MKIMFLTQGVEVPSSRYRVQQLLPYFENAGVSAVVRAGYGRAYNKISGRAFGAVYKAGCRLRSAVRTVRAIDYDLVFVQKMALPFTGIPERILAGRSARLMFDFDDAIYLAADGAPSKARESAFRSVVGASNWVVAGNRHLADVAGALDKTTVIPTGIDTTRYCGPVGPREKGPVIVGWMGTAGNFVHLKPVLPSILAAVEETGATLRLVSNRTLTELVGHPHVEQIPWAPETEVALLRSFDIGLMPLNDSAQARGKCGFKLIQYMAVGCPVIGSRVGASIDVVGETDAGVLVDPDVRDWAPALRRLINDPALRAQQGAVGRSHCVRHYSAASVADKYLQLFERLVHS